MRYTPQEELIARRMTRRRALAEKRARERAEKMGAKVVEEITFAQLIARDGRDCYLCGQFMSVHDMTFDHVIPLIKGGDHSASNLRLAHKVCNSKKGARLLGEIDLSKW